jgi:hypothetical protein
VGTFGVGSIAYYWSRLAAAIGPVVSRLWFNECGWQFIFADDLHINAGGPFKYLLILSTVVTWLMVGTPFAWHKVRGGLCLDWCGYYLHYRRFKLGISEARANWLLDFIRRTIADKQVLMRKFVESLGRLGFTAQVLVWLKAFLAPLYAWAARIPDSTTLTVPQTIHFTVLYLEEQFTAGRRIADCNKGEIFIGQAFRTDAKCEPDKIVLGGWWCLQSLDTKLAPWFSVVLTPEQVPWLFRKDKGSAWASATAELLAVMAALKAFKHLLPESQRTKLQLVMAAGTDNKALESLGKKGSSTKIPLTFAMMQLNGILGSMQMRADLQWRPREMNTEADDLTNQKTEAFWPHLQCHLDWESMDLKLLAKLAKFAEEFQL